MEPTPSLDRPRYLVRFLSRQRFREFCLPELKSLAKMDGLEPEDLIPADQVESYTPDLPYIEIYLDDPSLAENWVQRSVTLNSIQRILARGKDYAELTANIDYAEVNKRMKPDGTFAIVIDSYKKSFSPEEKQVIYNQFNRERIPGQVKLKDPDTMLWITENRGTDQQLRGIYFGYEIASYRQDKSQATFWSKYDQKQRKYLGPTCTEVQLAFLMINQGMVQPGDLVFDPFVGSGSLLIAASHFGAITIGADIDARVLHGLGVGRLNKNRTAEEGEHVNIFSNFEDYGLPRPEIIRCDNANPAWHRNEWLDKIICDPPYGFRAGAKQAGRKKIDKEEKDKKVGPQTYIAPTKQYKVPNVIWDLIILAARLLRIGGRLVYLLPIDLDESPEDAIPRHPCFKLIDSSENELTRSTSRKLITMEKISPYSGNESVEQFGEEYHSANTNCEYFKTVQKKEEETAE